MDMTKLFTSWEFVVFLLVGIFVIGLIITALLRPGEFPKSRTYAFTSILAGVTIVLVGFSLAVSAISLHEGEVLIRVYSTKIAIDKLWLHPNELLATSTHARPEFVKTFYYNNPDLQKACTNRQEGTDTPASCLSTLEEQHIAIVMLQCWEDFLTVHSIDATGDRAWTNNFIQWAQSHYLKEYYTRLKYNYTQPTQMFAELLFEFAAKIPTENPTPEMYEETVQLLLKDKRHHDLLLAVKEREKRFVIE